MIIKNNNLIELSSSLNFFFFYYYLLNNNLSQLITVYSRFGATWEGVYILKWLFLNLSFTNLQLPLFMQYLSAEISRHIQNAISYKAICFVSVI